MLLRSLLKINSGLQSKGVRCWNQFKMLAHSHVGPCSPCLHQPDTVSQSLLKSREEGPDLSCKQKRIKKSKTKICSSGNDTVRLLVVAFIKRNPLAPAYYLFIRIYNITGQMDTRTSTNDQQIIWLFLCGNN